MIVYADILVVLNLIIDFFLLLAVSKLLRRNPKTVRLLLGALLGGFYSLSIFLPPLPILAELLFRVLICAFMSVLAFGYESFAYFVRGAGALFLITCAYGGIMTAVWNLFHPRGMTVIRSVVYFNITPFFLVIGTVLFYFLFTFLSYIFHRKAVTASSCVVTVKAGNKQITVNGFLDTGNSLDDILGGGEVLIGDQACVEDLFGDFSIENAEIQHRYRVIPCGTVSGGGMLDAYRCDSATVKGENESITLSKPLLAVSKVPIGENASIIVNPEIFTR